MNYKKLKKLVPYDYAVFLYAGLSDVEVENYKKHFDVFVIKVAGANYLASKEAIPSLLDQIVQED